MIFIYNCFWGTHSSSLASAIHLNKLPFDRITTKEEILKTDYFNKLSYKDMGRVIYRGIDEEGNKVFTLGRGSSKVLLPCLENLISVFHNECNLKEIDFIGVHLLLIGSQQAYQHIVKVVKQTKETAKTTKEPVLVLNNRPLG
ncbi:conserved hypothetical protein [Desulforamulus reducens MI-1]|uniref:DUF3189 family protein n=1 Tax=Desulforamulus reducens (strain ATCC BAA-1160 / DSM 100696 / MI-1) TaxID=349161 RepID=A4J6I3_DESRM|nr:DUF3189 family protein [Desulforamulus reducens]ABO50686.1 conserved hypothetical protein [Desulforamulus reducens MI-1]